MTDRTEVLDASMSRKAAPAHRVKLGRDDRASAEQEGILDAQVEARQICYIDPTQNVGLSYAKSLWDSRQLLMVLIGRDLRVRYKQTLIGIAWVVLQPLLTVGVYSIIFGLVARVPSEGVPYPVFLLSALLPWIFVQRLTTEGASSVSANTNLVGKIYFPRLVLPLATMGSLVVDLLVGFGVALFAMAFFGYFPGPQIVFLPFIVLFAGFTGLSAALVLAPIDVNFRDVRMAVPIALQLVMYLSPIFYSATVVPENYRAIYEANPIAVIATSVRWALLNHGNPPELIPVLIAFGLVAVTFCLGLWLFVRAETHFADRI